MARTSSFSHQRGEVYGRDHPLLLSVAMFTFSSFSKEEKGLIMTTFCIFLPRGRSTWPLLLGVGRTSASCQRQGRYMDLLLLVEQPPGNVYWSGLGGDKDLSGKGTWTFLGRAIELVVCEGVID